MELLTQYNKGEFHLRHALIVEDVMRWFAVKLGYGDEVDFGNCRVAHDLDFEMYPDEHCTRAGNYARGEH